MTPTRLTFRADDERGTDRLGRALAQSLPEGIVVALDGVLGAGKTRLVQAVAAEYGVDRRDVVSPTFVLMHEYAGTRAIYHIDAYRLRDDDEFLELGVHESFGPPNLVFIEWADRVARCLPDDRLEIQLQIGDGTTRRFNIVARGPHASAAVERLATQLAED